jgi:hypothetical protein
MTRSLARTNVARLLLAASAATLLALVAVPSAQAAKTSAISIDIGDGGIVIGIDPGGRPKRQPQYEYVVQEYNPINGSLVATYRFRDRSQANAMQDRLARAAWVQWRFVGVNQPLKFRRFSSGSAAQNFILAKGPQKSGKLGWAVLKKGDTRVLATRVRMTTRRV